MLFSRECPAPALSVRGSSPAWAWLGWRAGGVLKLVYTRPFLPHGQYLRQNPERNPMHPIAVARRRVRVPERLSQPGQQRLAPLLGLLDLVEREQVEALDAGLGRGQRGREPRQEPFRV